MLTSGNAFASHFGITEFDSQSVPTIPIQASHSFSKYVQVHAGITLLSRIPKLILIIETYLKSTVHTSELGGPRTAMRRKPEIRPPASQPPILIFYFPATPFTVIIASPRSYKLPLSRFPYQNFVCIHCLPIQCTYVAQRRLQHVIRRLWWTEEVTEWNGGR
jgi:hypothetical protein